MAITLPLALIGAGILITLLFAAAVHALPLMAALAAGFAAMHAGASGAAALMLGITTFMLVIAAGRMATSLLPSGHARLAIALAFALPAALAGFAVAAALLELGGVDTGSKIAAIAVATIVGGTAAVRHRLTPHH